MDSCRGKITAARDAPAATEFKVTHDKVSLLLLDVRSTEGKAWLVWDS
jgi:hypothetical protein